jgi:predicted nucleotide-binding protein with TIR-like domain
MPVEVIDIGEVPTTALTNAISLADSLQSEFFFDRLTETDAGQFRMHAYSRIFAPDFLSTMEELHWKIKGYHPFLIAFVDAELDGEKFTNLFAANRSERGLGIVTIANVPDVILPADRLVAYILYYLSHQTLGFIAPEHKNHDDPRGCVFDRKIHKLDLLNSMRARALCKECRDALLKVKMLSPTQLFALDRLYSASGAMLQGVPDEASTAKKARIFIGSSTEDLPVANQIQSLLHDEFEIEVWNQNTVFGLGTATLEALEAAVLTYDFGIFVFSPVDEIHRQGQVKQVARDNVVFELGLFTGRLTRRRAFVVRPQNGIALPSDLAGITAATYDPSRTNLSAALGPACQQIRDAVASALHRTS